MFQDQVFNILDHDVPLARQSNCFACEMASFPGLPPDFPLSCHPRLEDMLPGGFQGGGASANRLFHLRRSAGTDFCKEKPPGLPAVFLGVRGLLNPARSSACTGIIGADLENLKDFLRPSANPRPINELGLGIGKFP
ncbi:MAG: hypothetical protein H3C27_18550 [Opitutaceae bacterium]|nr:hypothetical protein [Opitutaceae bacterium]